MIPFLGFKGPGDPMPTAKWPDQDKPLFSEAAWMPSTIRSITPVAPRADRVLRLSLPRTRPFSSTTADTIFVPPRSTPITVLNGKLPCESGVIVARGVVLRKKITPGRAGDSPLKFRVFERSDGRAWEKDYPCPIIRPKNSHPFSRDGPVPSGVQIGLSVS